MINNAIHVYMYVHATTIHKKLLYTHAKEKQRNCLKRCLLIKKMLHELRESADLSLIDNTLWPAYTNSLIMICSHARHWFRNRKLGCESVINGFKLEQLWNLLEIFFYNEDKDMKNSHIIRLEKIVLGTVHTPKIWKLWLRVYVNFHQHQLVTVLKHITFYAPVYIKF